MVTVVWEELELARGVEKMNGRGEKKNKKNTMKISDSLTRTTAGH